MFCSAMDVPESPFSFFESEIERLYGLRLHKHQLKENSIAELLNKRRSVAQMYLSSVSRLFLIPDDCFPDPQNIVARFPRALDVIVCCERMFRHNPKAAAIGLVTYRFCSILKTIDAHGGAELAVCVDQAGDDQNLILMLNLVRERLAEPTEQEMPENDPSSSYESQDECGWETVARLSSSDAEVDDDEAIPMSNLKTRFHANGHDDPQADDSDLIAFIAASALDFWGDSPSYEIMLQK
jgi:hypothetical protein